MNSNRFCFLSSPHCCAEFGSLLVHPLLFPVSRFFSVLLSSSTDTEMKRGKGDIPLSSLVNHPSAPPAKMASLLSSTVTQTQSSELDLKGLVQLSGEGICRGGCGALARAALQGCPLGLKGILRRVWGRLGERGGGSELGRSSPVVCPVKGHTAVGRLDGSEGHRVGLRGFDERADVAGGLGMVLGCCGGRDGERLGLRGRAEHVSHHL